MKPTVLIDFDGVLHRYESGWKGPRTIPDGPVDGAIDFLLACLSEGLEVAIHSSRSHQFGGRRAMKRWIARVAAMDFLRESKSLDRWAQAGYPFGMDPLEVEADYAGRWLVRQIRWPKHKVPAIVQLDDRAVTFTGSFPDPAGLASFKPWNR
ncbi:hypothetical protein [Halorhodospira halophila]|uniref:hypothetical protein n=1 Tax=Halorhodospira halophila TaxID=1053 RepID=UPI001913B29B|nr:hypothetical protein [Halorhodospira halophila]MBK5942735.1 hypothetical protein [Halorhodospira halophila]